MFFFVVVVVVVFVVANVRINRRDFVQVSGFSSGAHLGECLEANGSQRWQGPQIIYKNCRTVLWSVEAWRRGPGAVRSETK